MLEKIVLFWKDGTVTELTPKQSITQSGNVGYSVDERELPAPSNFGGRATYWIKMNIVERGSKHLVGKVPQK